MMNSSKVDVDKLQAPMKATHASGINLTYEWRIHQLKTMTRMLRENRQEIIEALAHDLGKSTTEALAIEITVLDKEIDDTVKHLRKWMQPTPVPSPALMAPAFSQLERKPLLAPGVLILGPSNFPLLLCLQPAAGSLAGGNPTLIKPSELCVKTSAVLKKMVDNYFEPGALQIVEGAVPETTLLLEKKWGMVFFTGSERVGRIVAQATAKTLTPTVMELGGKCPVFVDETATNLDQVASRIIYGKFMNSGQICVAPDTLIVHGKVADTLCKALVKAVEQQFGKDPKKSGIGRMCQPAHAHRLVECIKEAEDDDKAKILCGGSAECDPESRYICPTLVLNPAASSRIMLEELFGPVLGIKVVSSRQEAISLIQEIPGTPLAMYVFTSQAKVFTEITDSCPCASAFRNDCIVHNLSAHLPLGGLGSSGYGRYHGKHSFETFTHCFPTAYRPLVLAALENVRSHPYNSTKLWLLVNVIRRAPDIPVLHTRMLATTAGLALLTILVPSEYFRVVRLAAANLLEMMVEVLRA